MIIKLNFLVFHYQIFRQINIRKVFNYKATDRDCLREASEQVDLCEIICHDRDFDHVSQADYWQNIP